MKLVNDVFIVDTKRGLVILGASEKICQHADGLKIPSVHRRLPCEARRFRRREQEVRKGFNLPSLNGVAVQDTIAPGFLGIPENPLPDAVLPPCLQGMG